MLGPATPVLLVGPEGKLGEMPCREALQTAKAQRSDLVAVALKASPPVVKLESISKLKHAKDRQAAQLRAVQRSQKLKEMRFSAMIEAGDLQMKVSKVVSFLTKGHAVKVNVRYASGSPRELQEPLRRGVMRRVVQILDDYGTITPNSIADTGLELSGTFQPISQTAMKPVEGTYRNEAALEKLGAVLARANADAVEAPAGVDLSAPQAESATELAEVEALKRGKTAKPVPGGKKKPKGSPGVSREAQREWRDAVGHTLEVEEDVDSVLGSRDGDDVLGGARQRSRRARAAAGVTGSGRLNSGGDGEASRV